MEINGIQYSELLKKTKLLPGTRLKILKKDIEGRGIGTAIVKVVEVHKHHVLLEFGKYRESRRIADIALGICDVIG